MALRLPKQARVILADICRQGDIQEICFEISRLSRTMIRFSRREM
jgi:hypothetical protein